MWSYLGSSLRVCSPLPTTTSPTLISWWGNFRKEEHLLATYANLYTNACVFGSVYTPRIRLFTIWVIGPKHILFLKSYPFFEGITLDPYLQLPWQANNCCYSPLWKGRRDVRICPAIYFALLRVSGNFLKSLTTDLGVIRASKSSLKYTSTTNLDVQDSRRTRGLEDFTFYISRDE